jgi:hypothetical protein
MTTPGLTVLWRSGNRGSLTPGGLATRVLPERLIQIPGCKVIWSDFPGSMLAGFLFSRLDWIWSRGQGLLKVYTCVTAYVCYI